MKTKPTEEKKAFKPEDRSSVKHTRLGVWDVYEEIPAPFLSIPGAGMFEKHAEVVKCFPYIRRMLKDVFALPYCATLLVLFFAAELGKAFIPALTLWFQVQLLQIMQTAIDTRTVDKDHLFRICAGRIACTVGMHLVELLRGRVRSNLIWRIRQWVDELIFRARARLDVPTFETSSVQRQLEDVASEFFSGPVIWIVIETVSGTVRAATQTTAQVLVLAQALSAQRDGYLLAALTMTSQTLVWFTELGLLGGRSQVWAATTTNKDYVKLKGWLQIVNDASHRKEIVAGNLGEYAITEYETAADRVGDGDSAFEEWRIFGHLRNRFSFGGLFRGALNELPQIVFTLRAVQYPASMPVSLASLEMVQKSTNDFAYSMFELVSSTQNFAAQLGEVRKLYEVVNMPNKVLDGTVSFPEDTAQVRHGVALEFRNVSFKYPGAEGYALRNVSFSILPGQLCVIVGANGSGKSTVLKLIVRLYDPDEGQIFLGGHDIRTLKLRDLRQAISVLFQDYTHFPLSIRDNIALGDPSAAWDDEHVRLAARLGGAEALIDKLPEGLDTYLDRPVRDYYVGLPEGTKTLFGRKVDFNALREVSGMSNIESSSLSGGQMQRLAVARSFMRSVVPEDSKVGLLLFDEPSASLDPVAEQGEYIISFPPVFRSGSLAPRGYLTLEADLFNRLRELRGNKTMLFSSHRFGNLTRHADLILYMNDSVIVESGTHEELLKQDGGYANIWKIQAQAFL
ncbi:P-loop containing nucleoside triphosphate hydrolase protein [Trametes polyzona]|nr:P-loop containing nucleoside triphosphate hydrolase protein [Trametes polyzona]